MGYDLDMEAAASRLPALEMTTALQRGISMVHRQHAEELSDENRALRAEALIACGRSAALLRTCRDRRELQRTELHTAGPGRTMT